jgi:hypothetical protein
VKAMEPAFWQMRRISQGVAASEALEEYLRSEYPDEPATGRVARWAGAIRGARPRAEGRIRPSGRPRPQPDQREEGEHQPRFGRASAAE